MKSKEDNGSKIQCRVNPGVWRLFDASANRAVEAIRVIEDTLRFVLDDVFLTQLAKDIRHELVAILLSDSLKGRSTMRNVAGDVGALMESESAQVRNSSEDLVAANVARATQSLRSLQECVGLIAPELGKDFETFRLRIYALEKAILGTFKATARLDGIHLYVLVDASHDEKNFVDHIEALFSAGVGMIQIRDKNLSIPSLVERTKLALNVSRRYACDGGRRPLVIVNDHADVALATHADGVHVGCDDLPTSLVRQLLGPRAIVGRTAHSLSEAQTAILDGADYLGVGPCFPTTTKQFQHFASPDFLISVTSSVSLPAFAIGGVTIERLDELVALGFRRVAVGSAVASQTHSGVMAKEFINRLSLLESAEQNS